MYLLLVVSACVRDQFVCTAVQSLVVAELENCSQCSVVLSCVCCFTSVSSVMLVVFAVYCPLF